MKHSGILGMHWGVRRKVGSDGRIVEGQVESDDSKRARELKKKGAKNLSNSELKSYVERVGLESQYEKLNAKKISAGRKFVQDIIVTGAKTSLTGFATRQFTKQLDKIK